MSLIVYHFAFSACKSRIQQRLRSALAGQHWQVTQIHKSIQIQHMKKAVFFKWVSASYTTNINTQNKKKGKFPDFNVT